MTNGAAVATAGKPSKLDERNAQGLTHAKRVTPFEKEVADAGRRRNVNKKREQALTLRRQGVTVSHLHSDALASPARVLVPRAAHR